MTERNKITISFLPQDIYLWDFIQNKKETSNVSEYIRSLIMQDMNNDRPQVDEEKIVEKLLHVLKLNEVIIPQNSSTVSQKAYIDEEMKNTITNLF
ncbi:hypothetical protein [Lysinibacillus xylanilyticus]|uniref:hypothetical protein n=1 Tax=Lysinibacillus xylanilyticus TaxID=582475 RepID=UPI003830E183